MNEMIVAVAERSAHARDFTMAFAVFEPIDALVLMQKMDSKGHRPAAQAQYKRLLNKVGEITSALLGANNRRPFLAKTFLMVQTRRDKADAS